MDEHLDADSRGGGVGTAHKFKQRGSREETTCFQDVAEEGGRGEEGNRDLGQMVTMADATPCEMWHSCSRRS